MCAHKLTLEADEFNFLQSALRSKHAAFDFRQGAMIGLLLHEGLPPDVVAERLLIAPEQVEEWAQYWHDYGLPELVRLKVKFLEPKLRRLLPPELYADLWISTDLDTLDRAYEHLRTLHKLLYDHLPSHVRAHGTVGETHYQWVDGTLLFTDIAGFTPFMDAHASAGTEGAAVLLEILNEYFAAMLEIIGNAGGMMLEFTGDAILAGFPAASGRRDRANAIRAGLRMQRAMQRFADFETPIGHFSLGMRIGVHTGHYLALDIGTPSRMEHVLLGENVSIAKQAEGNGEIGYVCVTSETCDALGWQGFDFIDFDKPDYRLIGDMDVDELGEYDLTPRLSRRFKTSLLLERSFSEIVSNIDELVFNIEPLVPYFPSTVLSLLIENANKRQIPPEFPESTVLFVKLVGMSEVVENLQGGDEKLLADYFSRIFAQINAAVDKRNGILKAITYQLSGSDILIFFGVPQAGSDDARRAVETALAIRDILLKADSQRISDYDVRFDCKIGLSSGPVFAAEIGEPRSRREYNIIGDDVNVAARLMGYKDIGLNTILATERVYTQVADLFPWTAIGALKLKGKDAELPVYALGQ